MVSTRVNVCHTGGLFKHCFSQPPPDCPFIYQTNKKEKERKSELIYQHTHSCYENNNNNCFSKQVFFITSPQINSFPNIYLFEQLLFIFNIFKTKPGMFIYKAVWFCNKLLHKSSLFNIQIYTMNVIKTMNNYGEVSKIKRVNTIKEWMVFTGVFNDY